MTLVAAPIELPTTAQRPTRERYNVVALGCLLAYVGYLMRVSIAQVGPQMQRDLEIDEFQWGRMMSAFAFAYGAFEIPSGYLGDRIGPRKTLALVVLGFTAATFATGLVQTFAVLLAVRFGFGMFQAGIFPNIARMLASWTPMTQRASAQGLIWMCTRLGGASAPLVIEAIVAWLGGWRQGFFNLALPGVAWFVVFWWWFRDNPAQVPSVNEAELRLIQRGRTAEIHDHLNVPWLKLFRSWNLWALCLAYGCGGFTSFFTISMMPTYVQKHLHATPEQTKYLSAAALLLGAAACFTSGRLSDRFIQRTAGRRWGRRIFGFGGFVVAAAFTGAFAVVDSFAGAAAVVIGMVIFYDLTMPVSWAVASDIGERYAGTVSGMMNMFGNFGAAVGTSVAGYLMLKRQDTLLFALFAAFYLLAAALWLAIDSTRPIVADVSVE